MSLTAAEQQRKQEALEPTDSKRLLGRTSESRYTDPKRTSSSSFKPPMSKEAAMKNNAQTPQADSSIYSAFSYLKRVFVGKPTTETATPNVKSAQVRKRNVSPSPTKEVKHEAGGAVELEENANIASGNLSQPPLALTAVNKQTGINKQSSFKNGDKSKRVESLSNVNNRDQPCAEKSENDENKDIPKSDIPNYTPVRFVDNRSTYLHTPEKKGTTSFRITTARKHVPNTPMPTLLSPTIVQSQTQPAANKRLSSSKIKDTKMLKKKAGSPVRKDTAVSRMRSKSTPDSSSLKTRSVSVSSSPKSNSLKYSTKNVQNEIPNHDSKPQVANAKTPPKPSLKNISSVQEAKMSVLNCVNSRNRRNKGSVCEPISANSSSSETSSKHSKVKPVAKPTVLSSKYTGIIGPTVLSEATTTIPCSDRQPVRKSSLPPQRRPPTNTKVLNKKDTASSNLPRIKIASNQNAASQLLLENEFRSSPMGVAVRCNSFNQKRTASPELVTMSKDNTTLKLEKTKPITIKSMSPTVYSIEPVPSLTSSSHYSPNRRDKSPKRDVYLESNRKESILREYSSLPTVYDLETKNPSPTALYPLAQIGTRKDGGEIKTYSPNTASVTMIKEEHFQERKNKKRSKNPSTLYEVEADDGICDTSEFLDQCNSALSAALYGVNSPGNFQIDSFDRATILPTCLLSEDGKVEVYSSPCGPSVIIQKKQLTNNDCSKSLPGPFLDGGENTTAKTFLEEGNVKGRSPPRKSRNSVFRTSSTEKEKYPEIIPLSLQSNFKPLWSSSDDSDQQAKKTLSLPYSKVSNKRDSPKPAKKTSKEKPKTLKSPYAQKGVDLKATSSSKRFLQSIPKSFKMNDQSNDKKTTISEAHVSAPIARVSSKGNLRHATSPSIVRKKRKPSFIQTLSMPSKPETPTMLEPTRIPPTIMKQNVQTNGQEEKRLTTTLKSAFDTISSSIKSLKPPSFLSKLPKTAPKPTETPVNPKQMDDKPLSATRMCIDNFLEEIGMSPTKKQVTDTSPNKKALTSPATLLEKDSGKNVSKPALSSPEIVLAKPAEQTSPIKRIVSKPDLKVSAIKPLKQVDDSSSPAKSPKHGKKEPLKKERSSPKIAASSTNANRKRNEDKKQNGTRSGNSPLKSTTKNKKPEVPVPETPMPAVSEPPKPAVKNTKRSPQPKRKQSSSVTSLSSPATNTTVANITDPKKVVAGSKQVLWKKSAGKKDCILDKLESPERTKDVPPITSDPATNASTLTQLGEIP